MLKFGIVTNIDETNAQARVQFNDSDGMLSYWLPVLQAKTYKDKFYIMPDISEQVACLMDENLEDGVILGAIYSGIDTCPVISKDKFLIKFQDGSSIEYDKQAHILNITAPTVILNGINPIETFNKHTHNETNSVTQSPNQRLS